SPTPLIGREDAIAGLSKLLLSTRPAPRLLTLLGPGGVGKTRLAVAVATAVEARFGDGGFVVDLSPLNHWRLIAFTMATALRLAGTGSQGPRELLIEYLRQRVVLLLLDNFEHLLSGAQIVGELIGACPGVTILATSRAPLRLRVERRFTVEPLAQPSGRRPSLVDIATSPAVRLFLERAQIVAPDFALDADN